MPLHRQTAELLAMMASLDLPPIEETTPQEARAQRAALLRPSPEPIAEPGTSTPAACPCRFYRPRSSAPPACSSGTTAAAGSSATSTATTTRAGRWPTAAASACSASGTGWRRRIRSRPPSTTRWPPPGGPANTLVELGMPRPRHRRRLGRRQPGRRRRQPAPTPMCFQLLVYPATDARMGHPSITENGDGYFLTAPACVGSSTSTCPVPTARWRTPASPRCSRTRRCWPPARRRWSSRPSSIRSATRARPTPSPWPTPACRPRHVRFDGQIHGFFSLFGLVDDARTAQAMAAEAVHTALHARRERLTPHASRRRGRRRRRASARSGGR